MNERQNLEPAEVDRRTELRSRIRPLSAQTPDEVLLPFLDLCVNWSMDKPRIEADELLRREDCAFYIKGWGRDGDIAVAAYANDLNGGEGHGVSHVAEAEPEIIGLAWLRLAEFEAVIDKTTAAAGAANSHTDTAEVGATDADSSTIGTTAEAGSRFTGYGWVAADIPELSLAVLPDHQSQGIGGMLLEVACTLAKMSGFPAVSLAVEDGNGAIRLCHDHGFVSVGRNGDADILVRQLK